MLMTIGQGGGRANKTSENQMQGGAAARPEEPPTTDASQW